MLLLFLTAALAAQTTPPSARCQEARRILTGQPGEARFRRLGELPPARGFAAVLYHNGECVVPVPIRGERARRR